MSQSHAADRFYSIFDAMLIIGHASLALMLLVAVAVAAFVLLLAILILRD